MSRALGWAVFFLAAGAAGAAAQGSPCTADDTLLECWREVYPEPAERSAVESTGQLAAPSEAQKAKEEGDLQALPTGIDTGGLSLGSTTRDFLPALALAGLLGDATRDEDSGNLVFDLNAVVPGLAKDKNLQLQLALATEPEIAEVVKEALPEADREAALGQLEGALGETDDYTVSLSYNWTGRNTGRGFNHYRERFGELLEGVEQRVASTYRRHPLEGSDEELERLAEALAKLGRWDPDRLCTDEGGEEAKKAGMGDSWSVACAADPDKLTFRAFGETWSEIRTRQLEGVLLELAACGAPRERRGGAADPAFSADLASHLEGLDEKSLRSLVAEGRGSCTRSDVVERVEGELQQLGVTASLRRERLGAVGRALGDREMQTLIGAVVTGARQARDQVADHQKAIDGAGLDRFGDLVSNQPQLHFTFKRRVREAILGGDETTLKLTFEWGTANLKAAMPRECHDGIAAGEREHCLSAYESFVGEHALAIEKKDRLSFSAEYVELDGGTVDLSELGIPDLTLGDGEKLVASLGWSRHFQMGGEGSKPVRLDLIGTYEDVSDDPMRRDRGIVTLTVTRRLGDVSVPLGLVYANHGEYLTDVDDRLSAHVGLKYSLSAPSSK